MAKAEAAIKRILSLANDADPFTVLGLCPYREEFSDEDDAGQEHSRVPRVVHSDVTFSDVKKCYRQMAALVHPDMCPGDERAAEAFTIIDRAYKALGGAEDGENAEVIFEDYQDALVERREREIEAVKRKRKEEEMSRKRAREREEEAERAMKKKREAAKGKWDAQLSKMAKAQEDCLKEVAKEEQREKERIANNSIAKGVQQQLAELGF